VRLAHRRDQPVVLRLRLRAVAGDDLQLAVPQAGGDLQAGELLLPQRGRQLRLERPPQPQRLLAQLAAAGQRPLHRLGGQRRRPHPPQLRRRPGEDDDHRSVPSLRRGDDETRRRPDRRQHGRPLGHERLLADAGRGGLGVGAPPAAVHEALDDPGDLPLQPRVDRRRPALHLADDLRGQVVGGRAEPAGGEDDVLVGEEAQRVAQVLRPVADDQQRADVHPEPAQLLGQPRAVAVAHPAGEHLGTGDDDPCAHGHPADPSETAARPRFLPGHRPARR
jgi:hypothetical protein